MEALRAFRRCIERKGEDYARALAEFPVDAWPRECPRTELPFGCERDFHEYLDVNSRIQRQLGWEEVVRSTTTYPDFRVRPFGTKKILRIELEFDALNFARHRHIVAAACHLVLSFKRPVGTRFIHGIPIWSFYCYKMSQPNMLLWTLTYDIKTSGKRRDSYD